MKSSPFKFSSVVIIQSLKENDFKSGTDLCKYINGFRDSFPKAPSAELIEVSGRADFLEAMKTVTERTDRLGEAPILHIETHGWNDATGLAFPDKTGLDWHELAPTLAELNRATGFNLITCVAACFGGHLVERVLPSEPSPCFALIGPTHSVFGPELLGSFRGLYRELLTNLDMKAALAALRDHRLDEGGFIVITAEDWFFKLANGYLERDCTPDRLKERSEKIVADFISKGLPITKAVREKIENLGRIMAFDFIDRQFPIFFMTSDIPTNEARYAESLAGARKRAQVFFTS